MIENMESVHAFKNICASFKDNSPDSQTERDCIEIMRKYFRGEGIDVRYNDKLCVTRRLVPEICKIKRGGKLSGHFGCAKPLGRIAKIY